MASRYLAIGLDGADWGLVERLCQRGDMPVLARLLSAGSAGELPKQAMLSDDALWTSFATASSLGEHGRYHGPDQLDPESYANVRFSDRPMHAQCFWSRLSEMGRSVAILDVPKCPLASDLNGFQLSDWLVHGRDHPSPVSSPTQFAAEVTERFGQAPPSPCRQYHYAEHVPYHEGFTASTLTKALANFNLSLEAKQDAAAHYLDQRDWDLFVCVFKELHCAGHLLWDEGVGNTGEPADDLGPLKALYVKADRALGQLVELAGKDCTILVFSPHGMDTHYSANFAFIQLLQLWNRQWANPASTGLGRLISKLASILAPRTAPDLAMQRQRSLFFDVGYYEDAGALRFNLKGRDPLGVVEPGEQLAALKTRLSDELMGLRFAQSRARVVERIVELQPCFAGSASEGLPDLLVHWVKHGEDGPILTADGTVLNQRQLRLRPGGHDYAGWYIASGAATQTLPKGDMAIEELARHIENSVASHEGLMQSRKIAAP